MNVSRPNVQRELQESKRQNSRGVLSQMSRLVAFLRSAASLGLSQYAKKVGALAARTLPQGNRRNSCEKEQHENSKE